MLPLRKVFGSLWTAFAVIAVCVGFLADFPSGREQLEESIGNIFPLAVAILPYVAIAGVALFGGRILIWVWRWLRDVLDDGPSKRAFKSQHDNLAECKDLLIDFQKYRPVAHHREVVASMQARFSEICARIDQLNVELSNLDITMEMFDINDESQANEMIDQLARLEVYSAKGDLDRARLFTNRK